MSLEYHHINIVITQPTDTQISRFSVENIKPLEQASIIVEEIYIDNSTTQRQVKNKSYTTGSRIILGNIYSSVLSARGTPGGITFIDEYQDTPPNNAAIVVNGMRRSPVRITIYSGTALEKENDLQLKFDDSTGGEWTIKCSGCGHYNIDLGFPNVGKKGLICSRCGKRINSRYGFWVEARPGMPIEGFHINELCVPSDAPGATQWSKLLHELSGGSGYTERTIHNEILGNSYSDSGNPITRADIIGWCDPNRELIRRITDAKGYDRDYMFAGLDWAMETSEREKKKIISYTMLTIAKYDFSRNKLIILFTRKYMERLYDNPEKVIKDIITWLNAFNVRIVGMDYGVGHKENQRIAAAIGVQRCMEIEYVGDLVYGTTYHTAANKFCVDKGDAYDETIEDFKHGLFSFPKFEGNMSEVEKDLTCIYKFHEKDKRRARYGKTQADDFFQNLVYMRHAMLYAFGKLPYKVTE